MKTVFICIAISNPQKICLHFIISSWFSPQGQLFCVTVSLCTSCIYLTDPNMPKPHYAKQPGHVTGPSSLCFAFLFRQHLLDQCNQTFSAPAVTSRRDSEPPFPPFLSWILYTNWMDLPETLYKLNTLTSWHPSNFDMKVHGSSFWSHRQIKVSVLTWPTHKIPRATFKRD